MKRLVNCISLVLVFAMVLPLCSCKKDKVRDRRRDDDDSEYDDDRDDDDDDPVIVNDPSEFNNADFDKSSVIENIWFAESLLGGSPVDVCDNLCDIYSFGGSYSSYDYYDGFVTFLGDGFNMDGAYIKSIHFYLDDYQVIEMDFCITEEQFLSLGAKESETIDTDVNLPAEDSYKSVCEVLEKKYGKADMCDTSWMKADKAESQKWNVGNNLVVAVTWGENCFGIPGNNQMEIAISKDADFVPGCNAMLPTSDFLDPELESIIAFCESCFGKDQDTVKAMIEGYFDIELKNSTKLTEDSDSTVEYLYDGLDFTIAEVDYHEISIISNPNSGQVFDIIFWDLNVTPDREQYDYQLYFHKFTSYFGELDTYYFSDYSSYMYDNNTEVMFGGSADSFDTYFSLVIQNEDYNV